MVVCREVTNLLLFLYVSSLTGITASAESFDPVSINIVSPGVWRTVRNMVPSTVALAGPAFDVSIERLEKTFRNFNISHDYLYDVDIVDCGIFQNAVQDIMARWYYTERIKSRMTVIVTPGCTESAQINQLAAAWNMLFISTANSDPVLHDKSKSPTWITTNLYPSAYYGDIFSRLAQHHRWNSVETLLDRNSAGFYTLAASLTTSQLKKRRIRTVNTAYSSADGAFDFGSLLSDFVTRNRVLLFLGPPTQLRLLLIAAHRVDLTNGDYVRARAILTVYISAMPFAWQGYGSFSWQMGDKHDQIVRNAYESLLLVKMIDLKMNLPPLPDLDGLNASWVARYRDVSLYGNTNLDIEPPLPQLTSTTAALDILGQIINETLTDTPDFNLDNGEALANRAINRTFDTSVGKITFDTNGERAPLFVTTSFFNPRSAKFMVYLRSEISEGDFQWTAIRPVRWHGRDRLPSSQPLCDSSGTNPDCEDSDSSSGGSSTSIVVFLAVVCIATAIITFYNSRKKRDHFWWSMETRWYRSPSFMEQLKETQRLAVEATGRPQRPLPTLVPYGAIRHPPKQTVHSQIYYFPETKTDSIKSCSLQTSTIQSMEHRK